MDELKNYLRQHRDALDVETPGSEVWNRIEQRTPAVQPRMYAVYKWAAAAAIVVLTAGATWYLVRKNMSGPRITTVQQGTITENKSPEINSSTDSPAVVQNRLSPPVVEGDSAREHHQPAAAAAPSRPAKKARKAVPKKMSHADALQQACADIINQQLKELESTPIYVESPDYFHVFKKQWYDLEKDENRLKQDVQLYGLDNNGLMEYIQIHEQKLLLLKQLQQEINKMNSRANRYPVIQQQSPSYLKM